MFYRLIVENFKSFGQPVQFDMFPNLRRENLKKHVYYQVNSPALMKMAAIYGANGAGKSNLYKAFEFLQPFCSVFDNKINLREWYNKNRYRLPALEGNPPISFTIEFKKKDVVYILNLEIDENGVKKEDLIKSGFGVSENTIIYKRSYDNISFPGLNLSKQISEIIERQLKSFINCSFLAINGNLKLVDKPQLINPFEWFNQDIISLSYIRSIPYLIDWLSKDQGLMDFTNHLFSNIGIGLKGLDVRNKSFDEWFSGLNEEEKRFFTEGYISLDNNVSLTNMQDDRPVASITNEDGLRIVKELLFKQLGQDGYVGDMDVLTQSNGTIKLLILMPALYKFIKDDVLVIIDEFDNGLHPMLLKGLIKYLGDYDSRGQIIFTTHEDYLLDQHEILRPDEIWIVDKQNGISQLYSLNDFQLHKTLSIQKGYLDDRFGGIPKISF